MEPWRNTKKLALDILGRWCSFHTWPCSRLPCSLSGAHSMVYRKDILPSPAATAATAATCPSQTSPAVQDLLSSTTLTLKGFTRFTISDSCGIHDLNQSWIQMKSLTQCPDVPSGWLKSELIHVDSHSAYFAWLMMVVVAPEVRFAANSIDSDPSVVPTRIDQTFPPVN